MKMYKFAVFLFFAPVTALKVFSAGPEGHTEKSFRFLEKSSARNLVALAGKDTSVAQGCGEEWAFVTDSKSNLVAIKKGPKTGSGKTEVHRLTAASNYKTFDLHTATALHLTDKNWDFVMDSKDNLLAILKGPKTGSGKTEVHRMSAASNYRKFNLQVGTGLHYTGDNWAFTVDSKDNLVCILKGPSGTKRTEVHRLTAASNYKVFNLHTGTGLEYTNAGDWAFTMDPQDNLVIIKKGPKTGSGKTEVHKLSAASNYKSFNLHTSTILHYTDSNWNFAMAKNDVVAILRGPKTGSGRTEVHKLSGAATYGRWALQTGTGLALTTPPTSCGLGSVAVDEAAALKAAAEAAAKKAAAEKVAAAKAAAKAAAEKAEAEKAAAERAAAEAAAKKAAAEKAAAEKAAAEKAAALKLAKEKAAAAAASKKAALKAAAEKAAAEKAAAEKAAAEKAAALKLAEEKAAAEKAAAAKAAAEAKSAAKIAAAAKVEAKEAAKLKATAKEAAKEGGISADMAATLGLPTSWVEAGCRQAPMSEEDQEGTMYEAPDMNLNKCFLHCRKKKGMQYFATTDGNACLCFEVAPAQELSNDRCDLKCTGNPRQSCGGVANAASLYTMIDCEDPSPFELAAKAATEAAEVRGSYASRSGRSCGQDPEGLAELNGASTMAGTPEECEKACWKAKGANRCHGFTYDADSESCTFHQNVVAGAVTKKAGLSCFWKKVGYPR